MKKVLLALTILSTVVATSAFASVVKGHDEQNGCDLYRVISADNTGKTKLKSGDIIIFPKEVYGLSFQDLEINFDNREAQVQIMMNIIMGINRPLINSKTIISPEHQDFNFLINQLNRKVSLFEKVCINDGKIVYAKVFEQKIKTIK